MSTDQIFLLAVGLIVIAGVAITVAYATAQVARAGPGAARREPAATGLRDHQEADRGARGPALATGPGFTPTSFVSPASTRQVARVVAFLFIASVAVIVALTRAWSETEAAIFTLLAAGMLLVVLFMDMLPPAALGRWRRPVEGIGAIVYLGLLVAVTGGAGSPFQVGFFLVVAGTALSTEGRAPLAIALVGVATIALVGLIDAVDAALEPEALAWIGINAVALILLADIATAAARAQRHARDEALRASRFDALTGLYNRAFFFTTVEQELRRSDRMNRGFTMLMLDLDDLKPVNDTFGHQWGDRLLKAVADIIRQTIRFTDAAARYGGDEFVVLLPETDPAGGYIVGEKLRRDIAALTLHAADRTVRSSVSIGLVTYPDDGSTIEQLVAAADVAMYESKRRGKNRIVGYQTRTERVATAIEFEAGELVQLTPVTDVRTGGDPAPWGAEPPEGGARVSYGEHPSVEARLEQPGRRRSDRSAVPVEPGGTAPPPWSGRAPSGRAPSGPAPSRPAPPSGPAPSHPAPPSGPAPSHPAPPSGPVRPSGPMPPPQGTGHEPGRSDEPPQPRAFDERAQRPGTEVGIADQPWLTRTDAPLPPPAARPDDAVPLDDVSQPADVSHPGPVSPPGDVSPRGDQPAIRPPDTRGRGRDEPRQRPAADHRTGGRGSSRSDEIRSSGERPWIALPIEPYEPPERPKG